MKVTILGCGVYGVALANCFLKNGVTVRMWNKFQKEIDSLQEQYSTIHFSTDLKESTREVDLIVIAIPVAFLEGVMREFRDVYHGEDILIASKGIDTKSLQFAYEIVLNQLGADIPIGVISGGTFAVDMMKKQVMGLTLGTKYEEIRKKVQTGLASQFLKIQYCDDIIGVSVCGAIKNVMAIGFGILDGALYSESSRFLFLTEAIYEIKKLIILLGGDANTIMSYAGIDDIMMTCTSVKSRNYTLGKMLGEQRDSQEIDEYKKNTTIEGFGTSKAICLLGEEKNISLPLSKIIYEILYEGKTYIDLIYYLEEKESQGF